MGNGKITKKLKELGLKINEKEPTGETISEIIDAIADDYEGGTGGTTVVANPTLAGTEDPLTGLEVDGTKYKVEGGSANQELYRVGIKFTNNTTNDSYIIVCDTTENVENFDWRDPNIFDKCIELVRGGNLVLKEGSNYFTEIGIVCQYTDFGSTVTVIQMLSSGTLGTIITIDSTNYEVTDTYFNAPYYRPSNE